MSRLKRTPIDMNLAKEVLALIISPDEKKSITAELVIDVVAEHYDITPAMIISKNKSKNIAYPRQIAMYLCKQLTSMSLSEIGAAMGNRDHSTVIHGCRNIEDEKNKNPQLANTISVLIKKINPDD
jgi:chromosomal replication initiator protein